MSLFSEVTATFAWKCATNISNWTMPIIFPVILLHDVVVWRDSVVPLLLDLSPSLSLLTVVFLWEKLNLKLIICGNDLNNWSSISPMAYRQTILIGNFLYFWFVTWCSPWRRLWFDFKFNIYCIWTTYINLFNWRNPRPKVNRESRLKVT